MEARKVAIGFPIKYELASRQIAFSIVSIRRRIGE
jgi:hypothetical protein